MTNPVAFKTLEEFERGLIDLVGLGISAVQNGENVYNVELSHAYKRLLATFPASAFDAVTDEEANLPTDLAMDAISTVLELIEGEASLPYGDHQMTRRIHRILNSTYLSIERVQRGASRHTPTGRHNASEEKA